MWNHRGFSRVVTLTSWKFEMYYFLGRAQIVCRNPWKKILIKFTCKLVPTGLEQGKSIRSLDPVEVIGIQECRWWCLKRCDQKCRKLWFFKCMVAICHHVQQSNMFFFASVQLSPAVLHIGNNGTSDHTQSNAERKTNGISHHADTSRKLPEVKLRNWYLFPERTPKSSWLNSMKSTKKTNWATTKKDPGIQFNRVNLYLAVWLLEPFTKGSFFPWKTNVHFGVPRIPSFCAVPVAFAKQDVCEIPNDPTKHPPNVTLAPNSHHRFGWF